MIFDGTRFKELKKYLFENEKCFILENRYENIREIYLSPKIIWKFIQNLFSKYNFLLLQDIYLISIIQVIKPKVVLTFVDNSIQFSKLSKANEDKEIKFIALQNGARLQWQEQFFYSKNLISRNINLDYFIPFFFCSASLKKMIVRNIQ